MRKIVRSILVLSVLLAALFLTACSPAVVQGFVDLPDTVEAGITGVVVWLISWFFVQLVSLLPFLKFLEEFKQPLALEISALLISWIENAVPDAFGNIAVAGIIFVLTILAFFGVGQVLQKRGARGFR